DFDGIGSTAGLTGVTGTYVNQYRYLPFGARVGVTEGVANPFQYVGRLGIAQEANGLAYMRARFYSVIDGRFISDDPIGLNGGLNLHGYVGNNPISHVDPAGLTRGLLDIVIETGATIVNGERPDLAATVSTGLVASEIILLSVLTVVDTII